MQVHLLHCLETTARRDYVNVHAVEQETATYVYRGNLRAGLKLLKTYEDSLNTRLFHDRILEGKEGFKTEIKLLHFSSTDVTDCDAESTIEAFTNLWAIHLDIDYAELKHLED